MLIKRLYFEHLNIVTVKPNGNRELDKIDEKYCIFSFFWLGLFSMNWSWIIAKHASQASTETFGIAAA